MFPAISQSNFILSVIIGIVLGTATFLYFANAEKREAMFKGAAIAAIVTFCGLLTRHFLRKEFPKFFDDEYFEICALLVSSTFIAFLINGVAMYCIEYLPNKRNKDKHEKDQFFSIYDYILNGHAEWKQMLKRYRSSPDSTAINDDIYLNSDVCKFIADLTLEANRDEQSPFRDEADAFNYRDMFFRTICQGVKNLFEIGTVRASIMEYNQNQQAIVSVASSEFKGAPAIYIGNPNHISKSMEIGFEPIKYSDFPGLNRKDDEIQTGIYEDSVVICVQEANNKPLIALCIEAKGKNSIKLMNALIKLGAISEIRVAICNKFDIMKKRGVSLNFSHYNYTS